jgi:hypothetical protein
MNKHTQSEWSIKGMSVVSPNGIIAQCPLPQDGGTFDVQANKTLICAAPKLLEACQKAFERLPMSKANEDTNAMLKAAIASATGGGK